MLYNIEDWSDLYYYFLDFYQYFIDYGILSGPVKFL